MSEIEATTWAGVKVGDTIVAADGSHWLMTASSGGHTTLIGPDGQTATQNPPMDRPVNVVRAPEVSDVPLREALTTIATVFPEASIGSLIPDDDIPEECDVCGAWLKNAQAWRKHDAWHDAHADRLSEIDTLSGRIEEHERKLSHVVDALRG